MVDIASSDVDARHKAEHDGREHPAFTAAAFAPISVHPYAFPKADGPIMRPEVQTQLDNAKQSIGLLRRHL